ncbi:N-glycosylase/DNA lyase OGG1 [Rhododendron vialii]|uniref:N-glycosylase/DNA lyase OGG1 n=1 Tax=Rhododendron vialii TaxID=182163 RepID=UPI00266058DD|nr:N-glycosylase/DNA lyase OGG1 [Rhododendron vialii]XP_058189708.1 N-glycosylase/DNA lyase OGG1 [Rhododendron vialii]XP_058189709.1 N-glycosylase/DNA lyase OGG1 [Rhododendron vialii]XP_058189710.1 N-glycosylase/DNA lyase OGG1 [Rhododendron vialii]
MQSLNKTLPVMKRYRSTPNLTAAAAPPTPSTPPPPQTLRPTPKPQSISSKKPRNILSHLTHPKPIPTHQQNPQSPKWVPLNLSKSELSLPLTFPTGQTFRWKQTDHHNHIQYTGVVGSHLVSLKQLEDGDVAYSFHHTANEAGARLALLDFLNAGICLADMWEGFSASDPRFAELARRLGGARVLRQDPLECLVQFLCSSNNNIGRITRMVDFISSLGNYLGTVGGLDFHEFPSLDRLSQVSEEELREAGFGYRAKYIIGTVDALQSKPGGGAEWLASLREIDLQKAIDALSTLPGVGPKVAACIALFSLDQHQAIPVDTHVWQIATRYLIPELAGTRLTPKLCSRVADAFVSKYGKYAGWAQTLLFIAELPSQKTLLLSDSCISRCQNPVKQKGRRSSGPTDGDSAQNLGIEEQEADEKL